MVRFARSIFLSQVCWVRFAGQGFTGFGAVGRGVVWWCLPGFVMLDLVL